MHVMNIFFNNNVFFENLVKKMFSGLSVCDEVFLEMEKKKQTGG